MSKDGLCVIVTGSASGLGAATAGILAKGGARLVVNYSNSKNEAEATAEACRKAGSPEVVVVQGDVARDEDCRKIVAAAAPCAGTRLPSQIRRPVARRARTKSRGQYWRDRSQWARERRASARSPKGTSA